MENLALLNSCNKFMSLTFEDRIYGIDFSKGDLHDNWNSFVDKNNKVWDVNLIWNNTDSFTSELDEKNKPILTIYPVGGNTPIVCKVETTIGNIKDYFREL